MPSHLSLVVEIQHRPEPFWLRLPSAPWPDFVSISAGTTDDDVALVIFELAKYNQRHAPSPLTPQELVNAENLVLPGGVEAHDDHQHIHPSCCSGLECWVEWLYPIDDGTSPWMGHDPTPTVQSVEGGGCRIWPDEDLSGECIRFEAVELINEVSTLMVKLQGFHQRLSLYLEKHAPQDAIAISRAFWTHFRVGG